MTASSAFRLVSRLATATSGLMFPLIVIGSIVRTTGSGLACPDWPLCQGQLIPPLQFNVFIEWLHRLIALLVSVLLAATVGVVAVHAEVRARLGGLAALAVALLAVQILLGALTVWKLLDPSVVSGHLAVALLLFAAMVTLAVAAHLESRPADSGAARPAGLLPMLAVTTLLVWVQSVLGGMVSTHHASLACPDFPTCHGEWFPPLEGLVGLQMLHRYGAYVLAILLAVVAWRTQRSADAPVRYIGHILPRLLLLQIGIGVANVLMGIPVWVSALHLANAAAILALALVATLRVAALPAEQPALAGAAAR